MARSNIYEIMHSGEVSIREEYKRLQRLYTTEDLAIKDGFCSIAHLAEYSCKFFDLEFTNRAVSLSEIEKSFGYDFSVVPRELTIERVVAFCELLYNVCIQLNKLYPDDELDKEHLQLVRRNVNDCMETLGFSLAECNKVFIYVEKNPASLAAAELTSTPLAYKVVEYNHYRLKGNLSAKQAILKLLADDIEDHNTRKMIKSINGTLETQLYQLLNKFARHDHSQTPEISNMSDDELEAWYDDIYQMWLLAKLELDNLERKKRVKKLLG